MERLKFKMQGFWYKVWLLIYENDYEGSDIPPKDTCSYRWNLIVASFVLLITFPVTIYRIIYLWIMKSFDIDAPFMPGLLGQMAPTLFLMLFATVGLVFADQTAVFETYRWYYVLYGAGYTVVGSALIFGTMTAGEWAWNKLVNIKFSKSKSTKPPGTAEILYKGWRDKHCSPIEWVERDDKDD